MSTNKEIKDAIFHHNRGNILSRMFENMTRTIEALDKEAPGKPDDEKAIFSTFSVMAQEIALLQEALEDASRVVAESAVIIAENRRRLEGLDAVERVVN